MLYFSKNYLKCSKIVQLIGQLTTHVSDWLTDLGTVDANKADEFSE